jgi:ABC-type molybdate transport system substrate-binding protein
MRFVSTCLAFVVLLGVAMSDAIADEKKEKPDLSKKESFTEKVTVREFAGGMLLNPVKDVPAAYWEVEGKRVIYILAASCGKGSEVTDQKTGDVWIVDSATKGTRNFTYILCEVKKKP